MRLRRCYIGRYRVLRQLDITFDTGSDPGRLELDFLVGPNGCGKSTLLQALALVIKKLEQGVDEVPFPFWIEYELGAEANSRTVQIGNCNPDGKPEYSGVAVARWRQGKQEWTPIKGSVEEFLPGLVILTTGREDEWQQLLGLVQQQDAAADTFEPLIDRSQRTTVIDDATRTKHEQRLLSEQAGFPFSAEQNRDASQQLVSFVSTEALPLVTLCGILTEFQESGDFGRMKDVFGDTRIRQVCGFSLRFRLSLAKANERREIEEIARLADRVVHSGADWLLYFDLAKQPKQSADQLLRERGGAFALYQQLWRLSTSDVAAERVLQTTNIFVKRGRGDRDAARDAELVRDAPLQPLAWLSDGERSFLGRMSLFSMLRGQERLILLDEPEVHFNDYWKRQIVDRLATLLRKGQCHAFITTHSSITLTDVPREDIVVMQRGEQYTRRSGSPSLKTLAADPSDIIVHVFDSPYATGQYAVNRVRGVLQEVGERTDDDSRTKLNRLLDEVGPGYWSYRIRRELARFPRSN